MTDRWQSHYACNTDVDKGSDENQVAQNIRMASIGEETMSSDEQKKIIHVIQDFIERAEALERQGKIKESEEVINACLIAATEKQLPLMDGQLVVIWQLMGFCCADRHDWDGALEWYGRAEEFLMATPALCPDPESQRSAGKWCQFLPEGVKVMVRRDFPAQEVLANLYDSIALAYGQKADIFRRDEKWFELEVVAGKMLRVAELSKTKCSVLPAYRFLALSQANQNRPFKSLEYSVKAIELGRESRDDQIKYDIKLAGKVLEILRPRVLEKGEVDFLEPLVYAESVLNDPNLARDRELLAKLSKSQPPETCPRSIPAGTMASLENVGLVLEYFARRHCGNPSRVEKQKGFWGALFGGLLEVEKKVWMIDIVQVVHEREGSGIEVTEDQCMALTIHGKPNVIISVELALEGCKASFSVTDLERLAILSPENITVIPNSSEELLDFLNNLIVSGLLMKTDCGLIPGEKALASVAG
jgi:hypothetical protein